MCLFSVNGNSVAAICLLYGNSHHLTVGSGKVFSDVIGADRDLSVSAVDKNRKLRTAYIPYNSSLIHKVIGKTTFEKDIKSKQQTVVKKKLASGFNKITQECGNPL